MACRRCCRGGCSLKALTVTLERPAPSASELAVKRLKQSRGLKNVLRENSNNPNEFLVQPVQLECERGSEQSGHREANSSNFDEGRRDENQLSEETTSS